MPAAMLAYREDRVSHCSFHLITTVTEYINEETGFAHFMYIPKAHIDRYGRVSNRGMERGCLPYVISFNLGFLNNNRQASNNF